MPDIRPIKELLRAGEVPVLPHKILLRGGRALEKIVPFAVVKKEVGFGLRAFCLGESCYVRRLDLDAVEGLEVVAGTNSLKGLPLLRFNYLNARTNLPEGKPRAIVPTQIMFGNAHAHLKESKDDLYFVGVDTQYLTDGLRKFPLWRMGVYGESIQFVDEFVTR